MKDPRSINELFKAGGKRLGALAARAKARNAVLEHVRRALPAKLKDTVVTAGIENQRLTIGVAGAQWSARLRYLTETLRLRVSESMGVGILSVRLKVVPPRA